LLSGELLFGFIGLRLSNEVSGGHLKNLIGAQNLWSAATWQRHFQGAQNDPARPKPTLAEA
jgi:hypothetical protein